jgi:hypothetical protein
MTDISVNGKPPNPVSACPHQIRSRDKGMAIPRAAFCLFAEVYRLGGTPLNTCHALFTASAEHGFAPGHFDIGHGADFRAQTARRTIASGGEFCRLAMHLPPKWL